MASVQQREGAMRWIPLYFFFNGNEQTKAEGAGYFHIFETAWIYWVGVAPQKCLSAVGATDS